MSVPLPPPKTRIVIFDIARILLITLVINLHIRIITAGEPNILNQFGLYGVPIFLMLSFFLMSKYYLKDNLPLDDLKKRLKRLVIPLVIWSIIGFLPNLSFLSVPNMLLQLGTGELVNVPLYYLNLLILFTIIGWVLTYIRLSYRIFIYGVLILIALTLQYTLGNYYLFEPTSLVWRNSYGRFFELLPYSMFGILFGVISSSLKKPWILYTSLFSLYLICFIATLGFPQPLGFRYAGHTLLFGSLTVFSLLLLLIPLTLPPKVQIVIQILGKYSFGVYLIHYPLLELLTLSNSSLTHFITNFSLLFLLIYTVFCYLICMILNTITRNRFSFLFT